MQTYLSQLIYDLNQAAQNPPAKPWIEPPPHMTDDPAAAELALVPFKSIAEWTGIGMEVFPKMWQLSPDQCRLVNRAIFRLLDALHLSVVDMPGNMPPEMLYDVLTTNWDHPVQYLPSSGMDVELCTGDPYDCPYGDLCDYCYPDDEPEIPEKLLALVPAIADSIDAGLVCFLNPDTLETEEIPQSMLTDPSGFMAKTGHDPSGECFEHESWDNCLVFEPLDSFEAFQLMENFAYQVIDEDLKEALLIALNKSKPFTRFRSILEGTEYLQAWYRFKLQQLEKQVKEYMRNALFRTENDHIHIYNGLYDDDGNKIEPDSVPTPSLCTICKHHQTDDPTENILCLLNRNDQKDSSDFVCNRFEKN
jgi:hypothetical protein